MTRERDFSSRPRARRLSGPQTALLAAGLAGLALAAWSAGDAWREHRAASARLLEAQAETDVLRARIEGLRAGTGPDDAVAAQAMLAADAAPPRVLARLAELLPGDVRLEAASLDYGAHVELRLRVAARNPSSFDLFVDQLQRSPSFAQVLPGDEDRRGGMTAIIRARWAADR